MNTRARHGECGETRRADTWGAHGGVGMGRERLLVGSALLLVSVTARALPGDEEALEEAGALGLVAYIRESRPQPPDRWIHRVAVALWREGQRTGLDPRLLAAMAQVESRFDPLATSGAGARGLLQILEPTGRALLGAQGLPLSDVRALYDVETNVALGARYLAELVMRFESIELALLAYNRGPTGARRALRNQGPRVLQGYPRKVLLERDRLIGRDGQEGKPAASLSFLRPRRAPGTG